MPLSQERYHTVDDFYNLPDDIHAELINGQIVYMETPSTIHQDISGELHFVIKNYIKSQNGKCRVYAAPFGVQLREGEDTILQPDLSVICGTDKITPRGCIGAPDWIIEMVSPSNPGNDYIARACLKIHSYQLHAPLCVIFAPNSGYIARYAPFIWHKSPTNCDAHLAESNFQTRSRAVPQCRCA